MLDLTKLTRQMQGFSQHLTQEAAASRQRLELAQQHFLNACDRQAEFVQKQEKWRDRILFPNATPIEPLNTCIEIPVPPKVHTVIATDGSQIAPNHHEIAYCYLLNIGRVILHYGQNKHPLLDSLPEIFYRPEDLYVSRQWGIKTEEWMSFCRTASEATVLAELACEVVKGHRDTGIRGTRGPHSPKGVGIRGDGDTENINEILSASSRLNVSASSSQSPPSRIPTLAMVDGSLIYWFLEQLPSDARDRILPPILQAWRQMRDTQIPLMGYLSASRSIETMNFLRFLACPHPVPDCMSFCPNQMEKVACKVFETVRDTTLWTTQLKPGQRGPLWRSNARILDLYEELQIYFCYVHVGAEIARLEVPAWVAENASLFDESLGLMLAQVQKGYGYPVAIAEAHNQAVVRGGDKARFFALLERQMIKAGLRNVRTSYKEARKRGSIA